MTICSIELFCSEWKLQEGEQSQPSPHDAWGGVCLSQCIFNSTTQDGQNFPNVPSQLNAMILHGTVNTVCGDKISNTAKFSFWWHYTYTIPIPDGLVVFGIHDPCEALGFKHIGGGIGVGTSSIFGIGTNTRRHRTINTGFGDVLASVLSTSQWRKWWISAAYHGVRVLSGYWTSFFISTNRSA